jgi:hypothetical protein
MEYDVSPEFAEFLADAINCHLEAFPELQEESDAFFDLFFPAQEMGCTLHLNFKGK